MKLLLSLFFISFIGSAQLKPEDFSDEVFSACKANDKQSFEKYIAGREEISAMLRNMDSSLTDEQISMAYIQYKDKAIKGFKLWQESAIELELDLTGVKFLKSEVEDREIELFRNGSLYKTIVVKSLSIFFSCSGKNLCFRISDAITINNKLFLGNDYVQLHWID